MFGKGRLVAGAIFLLLAGFMGAAGVILAAADAHAAPDKGLAGAATMLLFHAGALIGGVALLQQGNLWVRPLIVVLVGWVLGATLFSGDIALRAFTAHRLFPMAAPSGGLILIAAWIGLALLAAARLLR